MEENNSNKNWVPLEWKEGNLIATTRTGKKYVLREPLAKEMKKAEKIATIIKGNTKEVDELVYVEELIKTCCIEPVLDHTFSAGELTMSETVLLNEAIKELGGLDYFL